jgi:hypothetical protein
MEYTISPGCEEGANFRLGNITRKRYDGLPAGMKNSIFIGKT